MPGGYIWNLVTFSPVVSDMKSFESVDGQLTTDDRRMTEASHPKSSPGAFCSGELKIVHGVLVFFLGILSKLVYSCIKFNINILSGFRVTKRKGFQQ